MSHSLLTSLAVLDGIYGNREPSESERKASEMIRKALRSNPLCVATYDDGKTYSAETIARFIDQEMSPEDEREYELLCQQFSVLLIETASCHRIINKSLGAPAKIPSNCRHSLYEISKKSSVPTSTSASIISRMSENAPKDIRKPVSEPIGAIKPEKRTFLTSKPSPVSEPVPLEPKRVATGGIIDDVEIISRENGSDKRHLLLALAILCMIIVIPIGIQAGANKKIVAFFQEEVPSVKTNVEPKNVPLQLQPALVEPVAKVVEEIVMPVIPEFVPVEATVIETPTVATNHDILPMPTDETATLKTPQSVGSVKSFLPPQITDLAQVVVTEESEESFTCFEDDFSLLASDSKNNPNIMSINEMISGFKEDEEIEEEIIEIELASEENSSIPTENGLYPPEEMSIQDLITLDNLPVIKYDDEDTILFEDFTLTKQEEQSKEESLEIPHLAENSTESSIVKTVPVFEITTITTTSSEKNTPSEEDIDSVFDYLTIELPFEDTMANPSEYTFEAPPKEPKRIPPQSGANKRIPNNNNVPALKFEEPTENQLIIPPQRY